MLDKFRDSKVSVHSHSIRCHKLRWNKNIGLMSGSILLCSLFCKNRNFIHNIQYCSVHCVSICILTFWFRTDAENNNHTQESDSNEGRGVWGGGKYTTTSFMGCVFHGLLWWWWDQGDGMGGTSSTNGEKWEILKNSSRKPEGKTALDTLYQLNKKWPPLMETAGSLSSQQPLATTLYAEQQGSFFFYSSTLLDTQWYNTQLKHTAWAVLYMQAVMDTLYELAGPIKGGHF